MNEYFLQLFIIVHASYGGMAHLSSSSKSYFQQNTTIEQYQKKKHFLDFSKHIKISLYLSVVTREAAGLIKLAT